MFKWCWCSQQCKTIILFQLWFGVNHSGHAVRVDLWRHVLLMVVPSQMACPSLRWFEFPSAVCFIVEPTAVLISPGIAYYLPNHRVTHYRTSFSPITFQPVKKIHNNIQPLQHVSSFPIVYLICNDRNFNIPPSFNNMK